jgi:hypothetical protein
MRLFDRRFVLCIVSFAAIGALSRAPVLAQARSQITETVDLHSVSTEKLVQQGTSSLRYGRRLENAISYFREAANREPSDARVNVMLACAQAQRAYTLSRALAEKPMYERRVASLKAWQDAQKDETDPRYGKPAPEVGDFPTTQDDGKRFEMTPENAEARIRELSLEAIALLDTAKALSEKDDPEVRAELANLTGWTLLLLWRDPRRVVPGSWPRKNGTQEGPERVIAALESATTLQPESEMYLQALSDGCILAASDPRRFPIVRPARFDAGLHARGTALLRRIAERRPRQGAFWFRVSSLEGRTDFQSAMSATRSPESTEALTRAVRAEPSNALYAYALAAVLAEPGGEARVIERVEKGNAAAPLVPARYRYAVPTVLAWAFPPEAISFPQFEVSIVASVERWVSAARKAKNAADVDRALSAMVGMQRKFGAAKNSRGLTPEEHDQFSAADLTWSSMVQSITATRKTDFENAPGETPG